MCGTGLFLTLGISIPKGCQVNLGGRSRVTPGLLEVHREGWPGLPMHPVSRFAVCFQDVVALQGNVSPAVESTRTFKSSCDHRRP